MSAISRRIVRELSDREFRNTYKRARVRSKLAYQIRALRKQRDWLQGKLAEVMNKPQSTVSRFEDDDYGKLTLETLFEISDAFDLGLVVEFVGYQEFLVRTSDLSSDRLRASSFDAKSLEFLTREIPPNAAHVHQAHATDSSAVETIEVAQRGILISLRADNQIGNYQIEATTGVANVG
jgi:transcriptional regulator with XRE-family HTH domain